MHDLIYPAICLVVAGVGLIFASRVAKRQTAIDVMQWSGIAAVVIGAAVLIWTGIDMIVHKL